MHGTILNTPFTKKSKANLSRLALLFETLFFKNLEVPLQSAFNNFIYYCWIKQR